MVAPFPPRKGGVTVQTALLTRYLEQEGVEVKLVRAGAGRQLLIPGKIPDATDLQAGHLPAQMVGEDLDLVAAARERLRFLVNPDVAAPVGEKGGRRQHEDPKLVPG